MALLLAILLLGSFASPLVCLAVKLWVDLFAIGDSFAKVYLFLSLGLIVMVLPSRLGRNASRPALILLGLLWLMAVGQHIYLNDQLGLHARNQIAVAQAGDFSSNRLDHIHVSKAALGLLLSGMDYRFDAGIPYHGFFPHWLLWCQLGLLLVASLGVVSTLVDCRENFTVTESFSALIVWFVGTKACVDGGPLNSELVAVLPFLLSLGWGYAWHRWAIPAWTAYWLLQLSFPGSDLVRVYHFMTPLLALGIIWLLGRGRRLVGVTLLGVALFVCPYLRNLQGSRARASNHAFNLLRAMSRAVAAHEICYVTSAHPLPDIPWIEVLEESVQSPYRVAKICILEPTTVYGLCRELELHIPRQPVRFPPQKASLVSSEVWKPGQPPGQFTRETFEWAEGATINYVTAQIADGAAFTKFRPE